MIPLSIIILLVAQPVIVSGGTLESLNSDKVDVVKDGSVELKWKVIFYSNESEALSVLKICLKENLEGCIASGVAGSFNKVTDSPYASRVETKHNNTFYILKIGGLVEDLKLYMQVYFRYKNNDQSNTESDTVVISIKAYPKLLRSLGSLLYFNEDDTPTVEITASGIPRPNVTWKFNDNSMEGSYTNKGNDEYSYKYTLPKLTKNLCGYKLNYTISGWNNRIIKNASTVIVRSPPEVTVEHINYTVFVLWDENQYGNCAPVFTVQVLNTTGHVVKSETAATSPTNFIFDAKVRKTISKIRFNTSYYEIQSSLDKDILGLPTTPTPAPPVTDEPPSNSGSSSNIAIIIGVVAGVIVIIIIIVVILIYLKRKSSSQGTENSYNHVPLDRRDGAEENNYTSVPSSKPPSRADDPDQMLYAELGAGGGRTGPKPAPEQSNYAVVKVDEMGYPARGPTSDKKSQPTYAAVNRDRSRRHSPPPPDDDNEGVIV